MKIYYSPQTEYQPAELEIYFSAEDFIDNFKHYWNFLEDFVEDEFEFYSMILNIESTKVLQIPTDGGYMLWITLEEFEELFYKYLSNKLLQNNEDITIEIFSRQYNEYFPYIVSWREIVNSSDRILELCIHYLYHYFRMLKTKSLEVKKND